MVKYENILIIFNCLQHNLYFNDPEKEAFWKHCGKRRKCWLPAFFSFSHYVFYPFQKEFCIFKLHLFCRLSIRTRQKICRLLTHSHTMTPFDTSGKQAFWKHCGKRRTCNEQFLLYPQCFLPIQRTFWFFFFFFFHQIQNCRLQTVSIWTSLKFVIW